MTILISAFVMCLAYICFGIMDNLAHQYNSIQVEFIKNNPQFWNKQESWKNKYKDYPNDKSPKFPFSKTIFVFATDGWHLMQFIAYNLLSLSFVILANRSFWESVILFICLRFVTTTYKYITMKTV